MNPATPSGTRSRVPFLRASAWSAMSTRAQTWWPPTSDIYTAPILVDAHIASRHAWKARIRLAGGGTDGGSLILHGTSMKSEYTAQTTSVGIAAKGSAVF